MRPCKSCPFRPDSLRGLWDPAHYLAIAYLGSADTASAAQASMGCHQWNGIVSERRGPGASPLCGGWVRAAREMLPVKVRIMLGRVDAAEVHDGEPVLSPIEMARLNGLDVDRLPPLTYDPERYADPREWEDTIAALRAELLADPSKARRYVLPGSPLDVGVTREQVAAAMGSDVADRYFGVEFDEE